MKANVIKLTTLAVLPAAWLAFTSCSSTSSTPTLQSTSATTVQEGVLGGVVVRTHQITATVAEIDAASRKVTLTGPDGKKSTIKCGPEVINFDQIHVGDQLKATVTEELAVYMAPEGTPPSDHGTAVVTLAPKGAKPGGIAAATVQVTAKVTAIDLPHHEATLQFSDGATRTVAVRPDVDLTKRQVGEQVVICVTESIAISVEQP